ncbi:TPA: 16S rRNA processing protein RimM [Candidatus Sumerlaeota bacterium]|nr:16S rRNA processing protein RimM [Candidatus Sumerlaeota bacterium]
MTNPNNFFKIGQIVKPRGIHGEVKIYIVCDGPEHFDECLGEDGRIYGWPADKPCPAEPLELIVEDLRFHDGHALVRFRGKEKIEDVENLRGYALGLRLEDLPPAGEETYYFHELEGLDVYDENGIQIGVIQKVEENPAHPLIVINPTDGGPIFRAPWVSAFVHNVDLEKRRVEIALPPGLRDL